MLLGEEVRVRRVRAVEPRLRPEDELSDLRVPRGDASRASCPTLSSSCAQAVACVGDGEEGQVGDGVDALGGEDLGDAVPRRWVA